MAYLKREVTDIKEEFIRNLVETIFQGYTIIYKVDSVTYISDVQEMANHVEHLRTLRKVGSSEVLKWAITHFEPLKLIQIRFFPNRSNAVELN